MQDRRSQATSLEREDFKFQKEAVSLMETWEIGGCLHGRSVDRGVILFPVISLCIRPRLVRKATYEFDERFMKNNAQHV